jgi:hypothetical protein
MTSSFANARAMPDSSGVIFSCDYCNGIRSDLYWAKLPPTPSFDSTPRNRYVQVPITVTGQSGDQVRIRFGYAENGAPGAYRCTSRQEACTTDGSGSQPFLWLSETQHYTACGAGCTVNIPGIPGRVVYYSVERTNGSSTVVGPLEAAPVN